MKRQIKVNHTKGFKLGCHVHAGVSDFLPDSQEPLIQAMHWPCYLASWLPVFSLAGPPPFIERPLKMLFPSAGRPTQALHAARMGPGALAAGKWAVSGGVLSPLGLCPLGHNQGKKGISGAGSKDVLESSLGKLWE